MAITGKQIKAARALADMQQGELAELIGLTPQAIRKIEDDAVHPREGTLTDILRIFSDRGVEFIEDNGVRQREDTVVRLKGKEGFKAFLDDVYETAKQPSSRSDGNKPIYIGHVDDSYFAEVLGDYLDFHIERMGALENVKSKILVHENPKTLTKKEKKEGGYREYKLSTLPKGNVPFYVYGNKLAILIFERKKKKVDIVIIVSELVSEAYRDQFDMMWNSAKTLPHSNVERKDLA